MRDASFHGIFYQMNKGSSLTEERESCHDVNISLSWGSECFSILTCIVCSSILWLRLRARQLWGFECLHCMGFPWWLIVSNGNYKRFTHDQAMELAGNAFNAYMFAAYASLPKS